MAIPSKVVGGGNNSVAYNVFKITFSEATSDAPRLEAWDDYAFNTVNHEVFSGTTGNSLKPMIGAVATTDSPSISSDWMPVSATAGGATINRLKGDTNYVNLDNAAVSASGSVLFNLNWEIPYDASIPSDLAAVLVIRFSYSGTAPVLTWAFNDNDGGGTEGTPVWTTITPGVAGNKIKPADAGSTPSTVVLHRPVSSVQDCGEVWVVTS